MSTLLLSGVSAFPIAWYTTSKVTVTKTASSWQVTGTSIASTPIYSASSTHSNCPCVEQIFTQQSDPRPGTEDWTLAITSFDKSEGFDYVRMSATAWTTGMSSYEHPYPSPICRACYPPPPGAYGSLSASFPVDGVNTGFNWSAGSYNSVSATSEWLPISRIAGSFNTSTLYACVSVYNPMFDNSNGSSDSQLRQAWSEGKRRYISAGSFWGAVQFGKKVEKSGWVTSTYTATAISAILHSSDKCMGVEDA
jgi:hypothetical protein